MKACIVAIKVLEVPELAAMESDQNSDHFGVAQRCLSIALFYVFWGLASFAF